MIVSIQKFITSLSLRLGLQKYSYYVHASRLFLLASIGFALFLGTGSLAVVRAATNTVTNLNDSGAGSLRQMIADAAPGDTITFSVSGTITLTTGELVVNKDLSLIGSGASNISISGNTSIPLSSRVINNSANLTISGLTILHGDAGLGNGGAILNTGTGVLTITNSVITANQAQKGGGVFNSAGGHLQVTNSTFSANSSRPFDASLDASGGAIYNVGVASIRNSTFSFNSVHDNGSGFYNDSIATVANSTFTLGQAKTAAVYNEKNGSLNLNNLTITNNIGAQQATGLLSNGGTVNLANSIISGNKTSGNFSRPDCDGVLTSGGHNLIGNTTGCNISAGIGDKLGSNTIPINANLGPLTNNGGPTLTFTLLAGSPAIDAGSPATAGSGSGACEATDQRGVVRPVQGAISLTCDIGAVEIGGSLAKVTPTITWANPADITFGSALSAAELNATASVPGTFVYSPALGTDLNAGPGQTLSVDFTPTDLANFNSVLGTKVSINVNKATPTITWANPADITYGSALSGTQLNATASVPGDFVYSPAADTVLNAGGGQILSVDFTPTDSTNFNSVLGTKVSINVNKATPTTTWANPADITYGSALSGTELNATASVPGDFVYSPAADTVLNAGGAQILSVDFTPTDSVNYNNVLDTKVSINVNKATPVISWANPADISFGSALSGTQLNATTSVQGIFLYSPAAGTVLDTGAGRILSVDFAPIDSANYNSVPGTTVSINVNKATPAITWTHPADITFGSALSGTELNATSSVPGIFLYSPAAGTVLNPGAGQTLSVAFAPIDSTNYNSVPGTTVTVNVNKLTPTITWANPADITYGTALGGTELNATASVDGTFVYTPAAGTVLNAGAGQILSVDFTPTDSAAYNSMLGTTVSINVNKAIPTVSWNNPADITFGSALSGTELNATASVPGDFVYSPAAGTVLNAGAGQILSVDFTPTDSVNYKNVIGTTVSININKATPAISWINPADISFGSALSETELNATASVQGIFLYSPAVGTVLDTGAGQILSVAFAPIDSTNYNSVSGTSVSINVNKATPIITWANPADIIFGIALSGTELNATSSVPGIFLYSPAAGTVLNPGLGQILSVAFAPIDSTNYKSVAGTTVSINVNKATPTITWANPADITFGSALSGTELNATASVEGTFVYSPPVGTVLNAGAGQTLSVDFTPTDSATYNSVLGTTVSINVNKATPTTTWANPAYITYGTALGGTELNATASVPGDFVYSPATGTILNAGAGQTLSVDFTPIDSANYNNVLGTTVTINVNKATPTVIWANPADITFGSNLSGIQHATSSVQGAFVYSPAAGTILNAGAGQILSVDFMPTDSANYNNVPGTTVVVNVNKATPTITWANPADIIFGSALSGTQLNATASVLGSFVYNPAAGTVFNAGAGQTLSVDFTPTDSANYKSVLGTIVSINVNKTVLPNTPGKVKGEGVVNNGRGRFIFKSEDKSSDIPHPFGELNFVDSGANLSLKATSLTLQNISGKHALITGYATVNGIANVAFTLDIYDIDRQGSSDTFMIQIPALNGYSAGGILESGNIQIENLTN